MQVGGGIRTQIALAFSAAPFFKLGQMVPVVLDWPSHVFTLRLLIHLPQGPLASSVCGHWVKSTPSPSGHLGPGRQGGRPDFQKSLLRVARPRVCSPGTEEPDTSISAAQNLPGDPSSGHWLEGAPWAPCPLFSPPGPCRSWPCPQPPCDQRAGLGGSCPGGTLSIRSRLPGSSVPPGMVR